MLIFEEWYNEHDWWKNNHDDLSDIYEELVDLGVGEKNAIDIMDRIVGIIREEYGE